MRKVTSAQILNGYGPTETTIATNAKDMTNTNGISVGRPFFNVTEFVADSDGNELPPGIVGELYIGGVGVAKLDMNNLDSFKRGERESLGDIVLTGATGYLGIHILHEFLENHAGKVYCLLRGKKTLSAEKRLKIQLFYYFNKDYTELFGERIFILEGNITRADTLEQIKTLPDVSAIINSAALVKHFSQGNEIEVVNYGGVKNLIEICKAQNLRLIQVSMMSTVGVGLKGEVDEDIAPTEQTLYFRQSLTNKYVRSKFLAEREILKAVTDGVEH